MWFIPDPTTIFLPRITTNPIIHENFTPRKIPTIRYIHGKYNQFVNVLSTYFAHHRCHHSLSLVQVAHLLGGPDHLQPSPHSHQCSIKLKYSMIYYHSLAYLLQVHVISANIGIHDSTNKGVRLVHQHFHWCPRVRVP